jgi:ribosomal protein S18 acetylase RimI-like enzyme
LNFLQLKRDTRRPSEQVQFRQVQKSDLPSLEWGGEYIHYRRLYASSFNSANQGRSVLWIAELPGTGLIGQLFVQLHSSRPELADGLTTAYIYGFRIKPPYRQIGIGTRMITHAENDLLKRRYEYVTLNVAQDNLAARRLYERLGYKVVAEEPGIWSYQDHQGFIRHVNEPSWRMQKELA